MYRKIALPLSFAVLLAGVIRADDEGRPAPDFNRDVRPILSDRCFKCHGPDEDDRQAGLRLDVRSAATAKDGGRAAISPGSPETSEVYRRITSADPDERMPPPESKLRLTAEEVDILRRWIEAGAEYDAHWAFRAASDVTPPSPSGIPAHWTESAIDRFVYGKIAERNWAPRPEASRERLIRRLSFDLNGLPPTPEEVAAFVADPGPDAYEKLVDRLLASPRYGERMTANWLDVSRYADSYGFQVDRDRFVWPWRDWVIRAFNDNLPFDEFITWQLAGDLLPDASDDQILATLFNRLHSQKTEGGSVPEEFRVEYVADRLHTFGTAFLGLTLECARCHSHKFDPISTKEYYQLFAFFNQIDEAGLYAFFGNSVPTPTLKLASDAQKREIARIEEEIRAAEAELEAVAESRRAPFESWLDVRPDTAPPRGLLAHHSFDELLESRKVANLADPAKPVSISRNELVPGRHGSAVRLTGDDAVGLGVGNFPRYQPFSIALWLRSSDHKERAVIFHRSRAWTDSGSRGYQLLLEDGRPSASLIHFWPGNALRVRTRAAVEPGRWTHVAMTYDGSSRADGLKIYVDGELAPTDVVRDKLTKNITGTGGDTIAIGERFRDRGFKDGEVDEFYVFEREMTPLEIAQLYDGDRLKAVLQRPRAELAPAERSGLFAYFLHAFDEPFRAKLAVVRSKREARSKAVDGLRELMVMRELVPPRKTFVLERGHYASPTEEVNAGTPAVFPPLGDSDRGGEPNRLDLAKWLTRPDHPLTARVTVNRIWQLFFGSGLVATAEDFGSQGALPSHPALLDWLARRFVESDWDVKALVRTIVLSATYRQDSTADREAYRADPDNRWLARGPRYRLPAEMIRDNALAVSGLLVERIGGAPVKPYEVAVSFKPVARGKGDDLYRRSVYTYWKRTAPAPSMLALDAVKREVCSVKRETTASPLQALVLLNDPQFVEAARVTAERVERMGGSVEEKITRLFVLATSRFPAARELEILHRLYDEELAAFQAEPKRAREFRSNGEAPADDTLDPPRVAALGVVASSLLSYDECVIKR